MTFHDFMELAGYKPIATVRVAGDIYYENDLACANATQSVASAMIMHRIYPPNKIGWPLDFTNHASLAISTGKVCVHST